MSRPRGSGYEALPAHDELDEEPEDVESQEHGTPSSSQAHQQQSLPGLPSSRRIRSHSLSTAVLNIDTTALDAKLSHWQKVIKKKFAKRHSTRQTQISDRPYEILASVFGPSEKRVKPLATQPIKTLDDRPEPFSHIQFQEVVEDVKAAIRQGIHPKLNKAGSSGSYFARSTSGKTVGIFKPKDEEPYGSLNPKWTKWFHRNFLSIFVGFGRACLLPNFSYLSEAGAAVLSDKLHLYIVPPTELVSLSSPSFFYDYVDRRAFQRKDRPLPEKIGSFQLFMTGYRDASDFLRENPWPGRPTRDTLGLEGNPAHREKKRNWTRKCRLLCGRAGVDDEDDIEDGDDGYYQDVQTPGRSTPNYPAPMTTTTFTWTQDLMADFRLELEKLVILDVLMRNTDRGLDNFMVKVCSGNCRQQHTSTKEGDPSRLAQTMQPKAMEALSLNAQSSDLPYTSRPHVHLAAIDNSLSWPVYHPNSWRSYSYGWLYLPSSLIGHPFTQQTREHFLPLLSDPQWWSQVVFELKRLFSQDPDFSERMFKKQIAVFKGQAYNVVQSLRNLDEGPLELCRRRTCIVHDDEITVADDDLTADIMQASQPARSQEAPELPSGVDIDEDGERFDYGRELSASVDALGSRPKRTSSDHTKSLRPGYNRTSTHISQRSRPIPVAQRLDLNKTVIGGASGFALMEHMERVEQREQDAFSDKAMSMHSEADDNEAAHETRSNISRRHASRREAASLDLGRGDTATHARSREASEGSMPRRNTLDISASARAIAVSLPKTKVVIVERLEETNARPFFNKF